MHTKKILLFVICLVIFSCGQVFAISDADYLSSVESKLFNAQFQYEPLNSRLERLEKNVFGKVNTGTSQQRTAKLRQVFENLTPPAQKITQPNNIPQNKTQNPYSPPSKIQPAKSTQSIPKIQDPMAQYPIVDEMESQVLSKVFSRDDIYKRLDRLELVVFNRNFSDPLNDRVERLRNTVLGNASGNQTTNNQNSQLDNASIDIVLTKLETQTFNMTYQNEPVESRLARLETQIFNQTSPEDDVDSRLERLVTVVSAQPTSELYNDMAQIRQYQMLGSRVTAAAVIMMLIKGLFF